MSFVTACLMVSSAMVYGDDAVSLIRSLDRLALDSHTAQSTVRSEGTESEAGLGAVARENESAEQLNRLMRGVDTPESAKGALDLFRQYGERASNAAEMKAYRQGLAFLEQRLDFLARSESPAYRTSLDEVRGLISDSKFRAGVTPERAQRPARTAARTGSSRSAIPQDLLGSEVVNGKTGFEVYSPAATAVNVVLFKKPGDKTGTAYPMKKFDDGVWRYTS